MTDSPTQSRHHDAPRIGAYVLIFALLMLLLGMTYGAGKLDLDRYANGLNLAVAMLIAIIKAVLVILFFMHVKDRSQLTWIFTASGFAWLLILLVLSASDYYSRPTEAKTGAEHGPLAHSVRMDRSDAR